MADSIIKPVVATVGEVIGPVVGEVEISPSVPERVLTHEGEPLTHEGEILTHG